jgi:hypothetical protein
MKKSEAEPAIRQLASQWHRDLPDDQKEHPSFGAFTSWVHQIGYGRYLDFRSTMGAHYDAEMWFDDALGQNWRR